MKKSYYILARITGLLILLLLAAFAAIQHPRVQQLISRRIVTALSASLDADIRYGEFQLLPFNGILLKDLVILDRHPYREDRYGRGWAPADTFASARLISATFKLGGLLRKEGLHLGHVFVGRGFLHLVIEPTEAGTNLVRILGDTSDSPAQNMGNIFDVQNLQIEDFRFRMTNFNEGGFGWEGYGLNYEDLDVTASLRGHGLRFAGGRMSGICDDARIKDKSGCSIRHLGGSAAVGLGKAEIRNLHFVDSLSDLRLRHYTMTYRDGSAFGRYIHDVRMDAEIEGGTLALKSIAGFSNGVFRDNDCIAVLGGGCFHGHVDHFTLSGVDVTEKNSGIHGTVDGTLTGLPHLGQSCVDATLRDGRFTTRGLDMLVRAWNGGRSALRLSQLAPGETFTLEAKAKGPANRMAVQTAIRSRIGSFSSADEIRNLFDPQRALEINGTARSDAMALDKLLQTETLGALDARLAFRALLETESPSVIIDSLLVERLQCLGYAYRDLRLSGRWAENRIEGGLQSRDPNMDFTLQADVAYDSLGRFPGHIDADFRHCDLQATGLSAGRAETAFRLSADLKADFADSRPADVRISDWYFTNGTGRHHFGDLLLRSRTQDQVEHISVQSRFFDAQYKGGPSVLGFPADLLATTLHRHLPALFPKGKTARFSHTPYELEILFSDCREVCSCLQNGFYIGEKTRLGLTLDEDGTLSGRLASPRLAWNGHYLKQLSLDVDNLDNSLNLNLVSEEAQIAGLQGKDASLRCIGKDNEVFLSLLYDGMDKEKNAGEIFVNGTLQRDENDSLLVRAHPLPSFIRLEGDNWELAESDITWQGGKVSLRDFALSSGKQRISADGGFSTREQDTLHVQVTQLDLDLLNKLGGEWGVGGRIDGHASLASPVSGHFGLLAECRADSLTIDGEPIGDIRLGSQWNEAEKRMDFHVDNTLNGKQVLLADGHYRFPDKALSVSARADSLRLQLLHPVFGHSLSETGGFLSGSATLQGKEGRYDVASGLMRLDDALVRIHYTNVAYIANGTFHLTGDGLYLDDMHVRDAYGGTGRLRGAVRYKGLQDFSLDIGAEVSGLRAIDLPAAMRHDIDGELDVTGTASVTGPPDALSVDADLHTDRGRVNVPLRSSASASSGNLLTFTTEEEDPYVTLSAIRSDPPKRSGLTTRARLEITPEVTASIQ
ncbi:MAG: translocation/assembly module TamB domain-containing protein, partial [Bacteroidales bacterium]|nr:translocation/assembly module TamB domain-containing protein [Bacteroidales bacterium]